MAEANIIREFLMKLGYEEDEHSRRKFTDALKVMTETVATLGAAVTAAAAGVIAGVRQMASGAEEIYFVSQRTKSSARDIDALRDAFENLGGTAGQATAALEKIGAFVRASPGNSAYIEALTDGKKYKDAATAMEDLSEAFQKQIKSGVSMGVVLAEARTIGLSEADTLVLLQKDFKETAAEYRHMADSILGDSERQQEIVTNAHEFMKAYRGLIITTNAFATNFGDMLATRLKPQLEEMKEYLIHHAAEINTFLLTAADVIGKSMLRLLQFGEGVSHVLGELHHWFEGLTPEGKKVAEVIGGVAAAIFVLNTAIGKSPVVRLVALGAAIFELYQDFKEWKETGKVGLVDWEAWEPDIVAATKAISTIVHWVQQGVDAVGGWHNALKALAVFIGGIWAVSMLASITAAVTGMMLALSPLLAALAVIGVAVASYNIGKSIADSIEENFSQEDKAKLYAESHGLEFNPGSEFGGMRGYHDKSGKYYSTEELAGMYTKHQGPDSAEQERSAKEGYDQYLAMGATPSIAAAMIAQEKRESGFDSSARGDNGQAMGLYQWHADRRGKIMWGTGIDVANSNAADQRRAAWWELHNTERAAYDQMLGAGDNPGVAGAAGTKFYERPADINGQSAIGAQLAREYHQKYGMPKVPPAGQDITPMLAIPPPFVPGSVGMSGASADDNSLTVHQTNHINLGDIGGQDPNHVGAVIGGAVKQNTEQAVAQAQRNGVANAW